MRLPNWWRVPLADWQNAGFGVYIHWPFCAAKCPYCDFNSHVSGGVDHDHWRTELVAEIAAAANRIGKRRVDTIFFGGGTPSLMEPKTVGAIIEEIARVWNLSPSAEITLEANPTSIESAKFAAFANAGINRVSMGMQAMNDADLKRLGRMHSSAEGREAFDIAKQHFDRVSFDLIYARQDQSLAAWESELTQAIDMAVDHLSLYQLTIEPNTAFGNLHARGKLGGLPSDDLSSDMYQLTQQICTANGMPAYEVSNHASSGQESQHNLIYWRYGDYVGIGPGAHGRITVDGQRIATEQPRMPDTWLASTNRTIDTEVLTADNQAVEYLMMSLRLREGSDRARYHALGGIELPHLALAEMVQTGLLTLSNSHIRATDKGRMILNSVLRSLLA